MINFLSSIPQFGGCSSQPDHAHSVCEEQEKKKWAWSKTALSRLSYYFKETHWKRGNVVYKKGDVVEYVYIVLDGEFEL